MTFEESCKELRRIKIDLPKITKEHRYMPAASEKTLAAFAALEGVSVKELCSSPTEPIYKLWKNGPKAKMFVLHYLHNSFLSFSKNKEDAKRIEVFEHPALQAYTAFYMRQLMRLSAEQHPMALKTHLLARTLKPYFDGEKKKKWAWEQSRAAMFHSNQETHVLSLRDRPEMHTLGLWRDCGGGLVNSRVKKATYGYQFVPMYVDYISSQVKGLNLFSFEQEAEIIGIVRKAVWKTVQHELGELISKTPPTDGSAWITAGYETGQTIYDCNSA